MRALRAGWKLLRTHRELWIWCVLPLLLNLLVFALAVWVFVANLDALTASVQGLLAVADPTAWYQWIWVGPIRALAWVGRWLIVVVAGVIVYLTFTVVGGVLASPFLEVLSERTERILLGRSAEPPPGGWLRGAGRAMLEEGKRASFFVVIQIGLFALGIIPGLQPIVAVASVGFLVVFLPLDYAGYAFDRRGTRFSERRAWLWANKARTTSFGLAALGSLFVPGLNFMCLPWFVASGTWLAVDIGLPEVASLTQDEGGAATQS